MLAENRMTCCQADGLKVHFVPYWPANPYQPLLASALRNIGLDVTTDASLRSLASRSAPYSRRGSLVHLHWLPVAGASPSRMTRWWLFARRIAALRRQGTPVVWTAHNVVPHESELTRLDVWLSRTIANHASRIICHSPAARDELIARLQIDDETRMRVIPHGHYIGAYPNVIGRDASRVRLGLPPDVTVLLALGAIRPYKGVLELIEAFRRLRAPDVRLVVAGKPRNAAMDAAVKACVGHDPRIRYDPGHIPAEDLQIYFNAADIAVFPYRDSLTSGALILAMSFGRACIAPRLPGMADCLGDRGGFLYDPGRQDGLIDVLSRAVDRRQPLAEMGEENLKRARAWDWESIAVETAGCYADAAGLSRSAAATLQPIEAR